MMRFRFLLAGVAAGVAIFCAPASARLTGPYDFTINGVWRFQGDVEQFFETGRARLFNRRIVARTDGLDGDVDVARLKLNRRVNNNRDRQVLKAKGSAVTTNNVGGARSRSTVRARVVILKRNNGHHVMVVKYRSNVTQGFWAGGSERGTARAVHR